MLPYTLVAAGLYFNPDLHLGARIALVPSTTGVAVVGRWP